MVSLVLSPSREASRLSDKFSLSRGALINAHADLFFPAEDCRLLLTGCYICYLIHIFNKNNTGYNLQWPYCVLEPCAKPFAFIILFTLPPSDEATLEPYFSRRIEEGAEAPRISVNFSRSYC